MGILNEKKGNHMTSLALVIEKASNPPKMAYRVSG